MGSIDDIASKVGNVSQDTILGMVTGAVNDRRQLKQQGRLQKQQIAADKEMTDYSFQKQLAMWKDTSYGAQKDQMIKAGLNPGLLYGMGGAAGATTGGSAESVGSAQAPSGGGEMLGMMQLRMQQEMQAANIELARSAANKNDAEAENLRGGVRDKLGAEVANLTANTDLVKNQIKNVEAQTEWTKIQTKISEWAEKIKAGTWELEKGLIMENLQISIETAKKLSRENKIGDATEQTAINSIKADYIGLLIRNDVMRAQRENIKADTALKGKQANTEQQKWESLIHQRVLDWANHGIALAAQSTSEAKQHLENINRDVPDSYKLGWEAFQDIIKVGTMGTIMSGSKIEVGTKPPSMTGFGRGNN